VLAATANVVAPDAVGSPAKTHSVVLGQATVSAESCRPFVIADHKTAGAPAGAVGNGVVTGTGDAANEMVPSNAALASPWAHVARRVDTSWVLVMVSEVPPALANEPLSTLPPKEERWMYDWPSLLRSEPENPTRDTPPDAATLDVGAQRIDPPDEAGTEYSVAQSLTCGTDADKCPVLNVAPPNLSLSHFVRSAVIIAAEPELPFVVRGGVNVMFPSTAHVIGATKVTRAAPAGG